MERTACEPERYPAAASARRTSALRTATSAVAAASVRSTRSRAAGEAKPDCVRVAVRFCSPCASARLASAARTAARAAFTALCASAASRASSKLAAGAPILAITWPAFTTSPDLRLIRSRRPVTGAVTECRSRTSTRASSMISRDTSPRSTRAICTGSGRGHSSQAITAASASPAPAHTRVDVEIVFRFGDDCAMAPASQRFTWSALMRVSRAPSGRRPCPTDQCRSGPAWLP